jgi:hypothetical protein
MFETIGKGAGYIGGFLLGVVIVGLVVGYPIMWMMNYVFPSTVLLAVFGVSGFTFWKAFWLYTLCNWSLKSHTTLKQIP